MSSTSCATPPTELARLVAAVPADTAVFYRDLVEGTCWGVQAEVRFPAASLIKVPIMLELFESGIDLEEPFELQERHRVGGAGVLQELSCGTRLKLLDLCRLMIVVSDNVASNALLDRLGFEAINARIRALGMTQSLLGRRFMEPAKGERDNFMSARDAAICLEAANAHPEARAILLRQQYREKIPLMLPEGTKIAHKTGELEGVRHDAGVVADRYSLALLTRGGGAPWEVDLALARLSRAVYDRVLA